MERKSSGGSNDSAGSLIVGEERIFINNMEEVAHRSLNEKISANKGKNIYVGQWDTIKEQTVWQDMGKKNDVVGLKMKERESEQVEVFSTPIFQAGGGGLHVDGSRHKTCNKKAWVGPSKRTKNEEKKK